MNRFICKYSIIRFQPFVETEEFANIGVALFVPTTNNLYFKLLTAKEHERITHFFKPLKKEIYTAAIQIAQAELERIQARLVVSNSASIEYDDLIRPREDIIQYSQNRVLFSTDAIKTVDELFDHYVKREFAYHDRHEEEMRKRIRTLLITSGLEGQFKQGYLGNEDKYKVNLPFVNAQGKAAIKPIHFRHPDSSQLIDHGVSWLTKIGQLKRYGMIETENVLFAYNPPEHQQGVLFSAFEEVKTQIEETGIKMIDFNQTDFVVEFAQQHA